MSCTEREQQKSHRSLHCASCCHRSAPHCHPYSSPTSFVATTSWCCGVGVGVGVAGRRRRVAALARWPKKAPRGSHTHDDALRIQCNTSLFTRRARTFARVDDDVLVGRSALKRSARPSNQACLRRVSDHALLQVARVSLALSNAMPCHAEIQQIPQWRIASCKVRSKRGRSSRRVDVRRGPDAGEGSLSQARALQWIHAGGPLGAAAISPDVACVLSEPYRPSPIVARFY